MNIFERIKALNFPKGHYIVVGSGILAAKGIREANDLDIVVTPELFTICKKNGWELKPWTKKEIPGNPWLKKDDAELMIDMNYNGVSFGVSDLMKEGEHINDIWFISLKRLAAFKQAWGRPRDFEDIILIEEYLKLNKR